MRSFRHWTFLYVFSRMRDIWYRKRHPNYPWLTPQVINILNDYLTSEDVGIEWGSGRSTLWFARRVKQLVSIEHDFVWYKKVSKHLLGVKNVDYRLLSAKAANDDKYPYADVANDFPDQYFDFALVDGKIRHICMERVLPKLRPGALLILDDSERYVPSDSKNTYFESTKGKYVRKFSNEWDSLLGKLSNWRMLTTANGVKYTRIWIKPCRK